MKLTNLVDDFSQYLLAAKSLPVPRANASPTPDPITPTVNVEEGKRLEK
jgi:hypothetical protein